MFKIKSRWLSITLFLLALLSACSPYGDSKKLQAQDSHHTTTLLPDSVYQQMTALNGVKQQSTYLLELCQQFYSKHPNTVYELANRTEELVKNTSYREEYAQALYWKVLILNQENPQSIKLRPALTDLRIGIEILESKENPLWLARMLNLLSLTYYNLYQEKEGLVHNKRAQDILTKARIDEKKAPELWGDIFRTAGNLELYTSHNKDRVLMYFDKSYRCYSILQDSNQLARLLVNYAIVYDQKNKFEQADSTFQLAIGLYQRLDNPEHLSKCYSDYSTFHAARFKSKKEIKWLISSNNWLDQAIKLKPKNKTELYFQYGANFQNMAIYAKKDHVLFYDSAGYYYRRVLSLGVKEKNPRYIEKVSLELAKICPEIKTDSCTILISEAAQAFQTILDNTTADLRQASDMMEKFKDEESKRSRQQILFWACIFIIGVILASLIMVQSSKIKLLLTRLEALRSQMNPHFISNSLNAIDSLINQNRNEEASEYIIDFSRLCRLILNNSKNDQISLERELETLGYYLSLEKLRMRKKLNYNIEISKHLDPKKVLVPPLILQPFVENAIIHGIQNKQAPGNLLISIKTTPDGLINCLIEDDGVGRSRANDLRKKSVIEHSSLGIYITKERIETIKKTSKASVKIIDLYDDEGLPRGTQVFIQLPINYQTN